jgi:undecaprenyl-diphosphatase
LYLILVVLLFVKFKWQGFIIAPFIAIVILLADQVSVHLFKEVFLRFRPCHNLAIKDLVHTVDGCGGQYGFVSSHAANTFALAVFLGLVFKKYCSKLLFVMLVWATIVSYSRIYVGVHYPADLFCGALLGVLLALIVWKTLLIVNKKFNLNLTL